METMMGLIIFGGGMWALQDGVASILYYLGNPNENWRFNHAVRLIRCAVGLVLIVCGVYMVL